MTSDGKRVDTIARRLDSFFASAKPKSLDPNLWTSFEGTPFGEIDEPVIRSNKCQPAALPLFSQTESSIRLATQVPPIDQQQKPPAKEQASSSVFISMSPKAAPTPPPQDSVILPYLVRQISDDFPGRVGMQRLDFYPSLEYIENEAQAHSVKMATPVPTVNPLPVSSDDAFNNLPWTQIWEEAMETLNQTKETSLILPIPIEPDVTANLPQESPLKVLTDVPSSTATRVLAVSTVALQKGRYFCEDSDEDNAAPVATTEAFDNTKPMDPLKEASVSKPAIESANINMSTEGPYRITETSKSSNLFQTAGGRNLAVSAQALDKARKSVLDDEPPVLPSSDVIMPKPAHPASSTSSFQTAGGRNLVVSAQALDKARKSVLDDEPPVPESGNATFPRSGNPGVGSSSFRTAGGKSMAVSAKALELAKKSLLADNSPETVPIASCSGLQSVPSSSLFQTASGKHVGISETALQSAKMSVLSEDEAVPPPLKAPPVSTIISSSNVIKSGFQSASGNRMISISAAAALRAKSSYCEDQTESVPSPIADIPKTLSIGACGDVRGNRSHDNEFDSAILTSSPKFIHHRNHATDIELETDAAANVLDKAALWGRNDVLERHYSSLSVSNILFPVSLLRSVARDKQKNVLKRRERLGKANKSADSVRPSPGQMSQMRRDDKKMTSLSAYLAKRLAGRAADSLSSERQSAAWLHGIQQGALKTCLVVASLPTEWRFVDVLSSAHVRFVIPPSTREYLEVAQGCLIVPRDDDSIGIDEVTLGFLSMPSVNPSLVSAEWVHNHFSLIVWKFLRIYVQVSAAASTNDFEQSVLPDDWLSLEHVVMQLKYRYDQEIDLVNRSAFKRILEHDDISTKRMVLLVAAIRPATKPPFYVPKVYLTDGWYILPAHLDGVLMRQLDYEPPQNTEGGLTSMDQCPIPVQRSSGPLSQSICVGSRLITCGSVLMNCAHPGSPPLADVAFEESTEAIFKGPGLRLHGNATRLVDEMTCFRMIGQDDTSAGIHLGYQNDCGPFSVPISTLRCNGGPAQALQIVVLRRYPMYYVESVCLGNSSGPEDSNASSRIYRNERAEQHAMKLYTNQRQALYEKIAEELFNVSKRSKGTTKPSRGDVEKLHSGEEILSALHRSSDPELFMSMLTEKQYVAMNEFRQRRIQDKLAEQFRERNVSTMLKYKVAGLHPIDLEQRFCCLLTLWNPSGDLLQVLKEGACLTLHNLQVPRPSERRESYGGAQGQIQLSGGRNTRFTTDRSQLVNEEVLQKVYTPRQLLTVSEVIRLVRQLNYDTRELDCFGLVMGIAMTSTQLQTSNVRRSTFGGGVAPSPSGPNTTQPQQTASISNPHVYLIQPSPDSDEHVLVVRIWGGLQTHCLQGIIHENAVVAFSNVEVRSARVPHPHLHTQLPLVHFTELSDCHPVREHGVLAAFRQVTHSSDFVQRMQRKYLHGASVSKSSVPMPLVHQSSGLDISSVTVSSSSPMKNFSGASSSFYIRNSTPRASGLSRPAQPPASATATTSSGVRNVHSLPSSSGKRLGMAASRSSSLRVARLSTSHSRTHMEQSDAEVSQANSLSVSVALTEDTFENLSPILCPDEIKPVSESSSPVPTSQTSEIDLVATPSVSGSIADVVKRHARRQRTNSPSVSDINTPSGFSEKEIQLALKASLSENSPAPKRQRKT